MPRKAIEQKVVDPIEVIPAVEQEEKQADVSIPQPEAAPEPEEKAASPEELRAICIDRQSGVEEQLKTTLDWRDIRSGVKTGRLCTGIVTGVIKAEDGTELAMVSYKGYQVLITPEEMLPETELERLKGDKRLLRNRLTLMLGAEVDFVIQAVDDERKTILGSRRQGLLKKASMFYLTPGVRQIVPGRVAEARVIAVGYHSIRVEVFGVETVIRYFDLSWDWAPDLKQKYSVSDRVFVRVNEISGSTPETLSISCDGRSVQANPDQEHIKQCRVQSRYMGTVVNLRSGSISVRLSIGVNAIATGCSSEELPGRGDEVCFLVTSVNEEETVARGIVTRIIRRNS